MMGQKTAREFREFIAQLLAVVENYHTDGFQFNVAFFSDAKFNSKQ